MNMKNRKLFALVASAVVLVACGSSVVTYSIGSDNLYIPSSYKGKRTYNALLGSNLKYLNSAVTMAAEDCEHIANFVDGLVENDEYGRLSKALASKIETNSSRTEYTFTIKDNIKWMTSKGEQYVANVEGSRVEQFVNGEDFVEAARLSLDFSSGSDSYYLPAMFLKGGYEYWAYTYAAHLRDTNSADSMGFTAAQLATDDGLAMATNMIAKNVMNITLSVKPSEIPAIRRFERVGVEASTVNGKSVVTYKLENPSYFFLSVLTYTPFLPINAAFIKEIGFKSFGLSETKFLYNGAFILKNWTEKKLTYGKNNEYWDADEVMMDTINYSVIAENTPVDFVRKEFEKGRIDAFGVAQTDLDGWKKYVLGADETGTKENPNNDLTYSREIEVVDSTWIMELNVNRNSSNSTSINSSRSELSKIDMENTDRALKINAVREMILGGIDFGVYNKRHGKTADFQAQYQIWTYVPKGFVQNDDNGKDYIDYVHEAYAKKHGVTVAQAKVELAQGQIDTRNTKAEIAALAAKAQDAIKRVNDAGGVAGGANLTTQAVIKYPIKIEYLGLNYDSEQSDYDNEWIEEWNQDINACTLNKINAQTKGIPLCEGTSYPLFEMVNNKKVTSQTYVDMGESGQYHLLISGWGADYADPLTFMNTFVTGGDMAMYTGTQKPVVDYKIVDGQVVKGEILADYDELVNQGRGIYDNTNNRFTYFAEAEVELLFGAHIIQPLYMTGQGWAITVSKLAGYEKPTAAYGLSSYKMKGLYTLTTTMGSKDRKDAREKYLINKAEALKDSEYNIYG